MTDKEEFFDFIYCGGDYGGNRKFYKTDLTAEEVYNWFQSKQQEKIKRVKRLKVGEAEGWDFFFRSKKQCCPGDDYSDIYNQAISDVLKILKK